MNYKALKQMVGRNIFFLYRLCYLWKRTSTFLLFLLELTSRVIILNNKIEKGSIKTKLLSGFPSEIQNCLFYNKVT